LQIRLEIRFQAGNVNISAIPIGAIVWKTDDPAVRRDLEHSYSRDLIPNRIGLNVTIRAVIDAPLILEILDDEHRISIASEESMQRAIKHPLTKPLFAPIRPPRQYCV